MSWQILILISVVSFSVATILQRVLMRKQESDPIAYAIVFQLMVAFMIWLYGFVFHDMSLPNGIIRLLPFLVVMCSLYTFSNIFNFTALKELDASKFVVIFSSSGIFTVIASTIFLGESLNFRQLIGALFIFIGTYFVATKNKEKFQLSKYEIIALLGAVAFGVANTNDRYILQYFNLYPYLTISFLVPPLLIALIYPKHIKGVLVFRKVEILKPLVAFSFFFGLSALTFFAALQTTTNSSQLVMINKSSVILTSILSIILLKEEENLTRKILGALVSFFGLILIA